MIMGLSHIGLTVGDMEETIRFYEDFFGCAVLSDAERKGAMIDQITGIPGFHSRTVYLAFYPPCHVEAFSFFHPQTLPPDNSSKPQAGISYLAIQGNRTNYPEVEKKKNWMSPIPEAPRGAFQTIIDPNRQIIRVVNDELENSVINIRQGRLLYPIFLVENMEDSVSYYRNILGLDVESDGQEIYMQGRSTKELRWVILKGTKGVQCLKLISLKNHKIQRNSTWKMQKIGFTHVAFAVDGIDDYYREMVQRKVNFKSAPASVIAGPHQGGKAIYLTTPDGVTLEFIDSPRTRNEMRGIDFPQSA